MAEHKACPFCGGKPQLRGEADLAEEIGNVWIECDGCGMRITHTGAVGAAWILWDNRAVEPLPLHLAQSDIINVKIAAQDDAPVPQNGWTRLTVDTDGFQREDRYLTFSCACGDDIGLDVWAAALNYGTNTRCINCGRKYRMFTTVEMQEKGT